MTAATLSLSEFSLPRKGSENFRRRLAEAMRGNDCLNRRHAYNDTAPVKPILNVGGGRHPLQVLRCAVSFVLVLVMDAVQAKRVRNESVSHKAMNGNGGDITILGKLSLGVAAAIGAAFKHPRSDVSISALAVVDEATKTVYAAKTTDTVQTFVSADISPVLSGEGRNFGRRFGEVKQDGLLNVEGELLRAEPSHQISVDRGHFQEAFFSDTAVDKLPLKRSNSMQIGKFVPSLVPRDRDPSLNHFVTPIGNLYPNQGTGTEGERQRGLCGKAQIAPSNTILKMEA